MDKIDTKSVTAKEAKQNFGELMDSALTEPVTITRNGKPAAVMISVADFKRMLAFEDLVWALRAEEAMAKSDFLGVEETAAFLRETLKRAEA